MPPVARAFLLLWAVALVATALGVGVAWARSHHTTLWAPLLGVASALSAVLSWGVARHAVRPLDRLQRGLRALATDTPMARAEPDWPAPAPDAEALMADFDAAAQRLAARDQARAAFMRDVSHELRSPLTRMRLALELARRQDSSQPLQLDRVEHECARLDKLVGQLLWLSRPGQAPAAPDTLVDLGETVANAVADATFESQPMQLQIVWRSPAQPVWVAGRGDELASLCENILRNALRFSPTGAAVNVALTARRGRAVLRFADRGPGVPLASQPRLFEPFFRIESDHAAGHASLGLGLAIAGRVAADHGGRIRAANRRGGGLRVYIDLPLAPTS